MWRLSYQGTIATYPVALSFKLFGTSQFTLELPFVLMSAGAAVCVWRIGTRFLRPFQAVFAALAFWLWPALAVWIGTEAADLLRADAAPRRSASMLCALRAVERPRGWVDWCAVGLLAGAGWWTSPNIMYFVVPDRRSGCSIYHWRSLWPRALARGSVRGARRVAVDLERPELRLQLARERRTARGNVPRPSRLLLHARAPGRARDPRAVHRFVDHRHRPPLSLRDRVGPARSLGVARAARAVARRDRAPRRSRSSSPSIPWPRTSAATSSGTAGTSTSSRRSSRSRSRAWRGPSRRPACSRWHWRSRPSGASRGSTTSATPSVAGHHSIASSRRSNAKAITRCSPASGSRRASRSRATSGSSPSPPTWARASKGFEDRVRHAKLPVYVDDARGRTVQPAGRGARTCQAGGHHAAGNARRRLPHRGAVEEAARAAGVRPLDPPVAFSAAE